MLIYRVLATPKENNFLKLQMIKSFQLKILRNTIFIKARYMKVYFECNKSVIETRDLVILNFGTYTAYLYSCTELINFKNFNFKCFIRKLVSMYSYENLDSIYD